MVVYLPVLFIRYNVCVCERACMRLCVCMCVCMCVLARVQTCVYVFFCMKCTFSIYSLYLTTETGKSLKKTTYTTNVQ